ncbi:MAG: amidohydrolase [Chloroflexi bacterium]|nr:amidohydrolase [Chloroflexota bacterium]
MEHPIIDVDSHVLEPIGLWQEYLEPEYRDRAIRWARDDRGLEYMEIDGRPAKQFMLRNGWLGSPLTPGQRPFEDRVKTTLGVADGPGRIQVLDKEGIDVTLLYPTLGIQWEPEFEDFKLAAAHTRAYNSWITDMCKPYSSRLVPVAHVVVSDVQEGARELERAAGLGARGAMISGRPINGTPYGDPVYDPFWARAQDLGMPVALHVMGYPEHVGYQLYPDTSPDVAWWGFVTLALDVVIGFTTLFQGAVFERFPNLKIVVLEAACGWLPFWLGRMDEYQELFGYATRMKLKPSEYFRRQCWISFEPGEERVPETMKFIGTDRFMWAGDYPHTDSVSEPVKLLKELLSPLPQEDRWKVMGDTAVELYRLG